MAGVQTMSPLRASGINQNPCFRRKSHHSYKTVSSAGFPSLEASSAMLMTPAMRPELYSASGCEIAVSI